MFKTLILMFKIHFLAVPETPYLHTTENSVYTKFYSYFEFKSEKLSKFSNL